MAQMSPLNSPKFFCLRIYSLCFAPGLAYPVKQPFLLSQENGDEAPARGATAMPTHSRESVERRADRSSSVGHHGAAAARNNSGPPRPPPQNEVRVGGAHASSRAAFRDDEPPLPLEIMVPLKRDDDDDHHDGGGGLLAARKSRDQKKKKKKQQQKKENIPISIDFVQRPGLVSAEGVVRESRFVKTLAFKKCIDQK